MDNFARSLEKAGLSAVVVPWIEAMFYIVAGAVLLFCAPAFFIEARMIKWMVGFAIFTLVLGAVAYLWPQFAPANFFTEHPALLDTPLNPQMSAILGGIFLLFGLGLLLVLGCRAVYRYFRVIKM